MPVNEYLTNSLRRWH